MNIIETKGLTRSFGRQEAVQDVSFTLPAGGVCALLGPNGAGKSTLLRVLLNFLRASAGEARIFGVDTRRLGPAEYARIGHVSEAQALPGWMTVRELLDFCRGMYPSWDDALERRLLRQFELPLNRPIRTFSRGMAVKASLVSSLAYRPRLIVLDEPFSSLDVLVREELVAGLVEVSDQAEWTMLVSSHDFAEVERLVDRVALMDKGTLWAQEDMESLQGRFRRVEVSLPADRPDLPGMPGGWLEYERSGGFIRFVDTRHGTPESEKACAERYAGASVVRHPMSLREIFVVLARLRRANGKECLS